MRFALLCAAGVLLAGCDGVIGGGDNRQALVDACINEGGRDAQTCDCRTDALIKGLLPEDVELLAKLARAAPDQRQALQGDATPEQHQRIMLAGMMLDSVCKPAT
jgi:hypothetical protein